MRLWLKQEAQCLRPDCGGRGEGGARPEHPARGWRTRQAPADAGQQTNAVIVTRSRLATTEEFGEVIVRATTPGGPQ